MDNVSGLMRAIRRYVFADGRADIEETRSLIGLVGPLAARDPDFGALKRLLEDIAADGIVTPEESERLKAAISKIAERESEIGVVRDARKLGLPRMTLLGFQHLFAMFGSTVVMPLLLGMNPATTLFFCGVGTLLFHLLSKRMVPAFLGASSSCIVGFFAVFGLVGTAGYENLTREAALQYACLGVAVSGGVYLLMSAMIWKIGVKRMLRWFPMEVTSPIIIGIGLVLAPIAISSCSHGWPVALVAAITLVACNVFAKGMTRIFTVLIGLVASYLAAVAMGSVGMAEPVEFTRVAEAAWVGLPISWDRTVFPIFAEPDWGVALSAIAVMVPLGLASAMEHIGDITAISATVNRDLIRDPGLHRTLIGDGLATTIAGLFGATPNTTYSENTGVLSMTKVYDPLVIRIAAVLAIAMSFCPKISALIATIPEATVGGVTLVLYGMIAMVGVRNLVSGDVDLHDNRTAAIVSTVLVLLLGISFSEEGAIKFAVSGVDIALSGIAVATIVGIVMNAILPRKDMV